MTENILPKETVMLDKFASDLGLEMLYAGRGIITLTSISVDRVMAIIVARERQRFWIRERRVSLANSFICGSPHPERCARPAT